MTWQVVVVDSDVFLPYIKASMSLGYEDICVTSAPLHMNGENSKSEPSDLGMRDVFDGQRVYWAVGSGRGSVGQVYYCTFVNV